MLEGRKAYLQAQVVGAGRVLWQSTLSTNDRHVCLRPSDRALSGLLTHTRTPQGHTSVNTHASIMSDDKINSNSLKVF